MMTNKQQTRIEQDQSTFRHLMTVVSRPGTVVELEPSAPAYLTILAALCDHKVSISDPHQRLNEQDWSLLQTQKSDVSQADYVLCQGHQYLDDTPKLGTLTSPEHAATLIIEVDRLSPEPAIIYSQQLTLRGPGIQGQTYLNIDGLQPGYLIARQQWCSAFPLGVDLIFASSANHIAALPRSTHVEVK